MKKLLSILLCLALICCSAFTQVACDDEDDNSDGKGVATLNGKTPQDLYSAALAKVKGLTNYEMTTTQVITMSAQGQTVTMNQVLLSKINGQDNYVKLANDMESSVNMETWYVGEWVYVITNTARNKANITYAEMVDKYMPDGATGESALMNIPEAWFKDVRFQQEGEKYYIQFIVSGEEYTTFMKSTALGDKLQGVEDVSYKVYFDAQGELGDIITEFDYTVEGIACSAVSTSKIANIGGVSIEAPQGNFNDVTNFMP
ncbi:MAG: hypothetical protein IJW16_08715 [Clostridia bacterium]|nr:hypothetical protein [Clostridia bacterium]